VVPVPWASTASMSFGSRPALASACRITRSCEGPLGALRPFEAPSWLTALPLITERIVRSLRCASERRSSTSMPTPSASAVPSAPSAKALQRPFGASAPWKLNWISIAGEASTVTPPASASAHSPWRSARAARCSATREEEQAVSTVIAGPCRPKL
jgi:hypothetical protein